MSRLHDQIRKEFAPRQVGIIEFAESEEFCGKRLYPYQRIFLKMVFLEELEGWEEDLLTRWIQGGRANEVSLSPEIRQRIDICREREYPHFSEICMVAGRRASKGHITAIAMAKKLYDIAQIPSPGDFFDIDIDKTIHFSCIAASMDQAKVNQFADLYSTITRCKALQDRISNPLEESITIKTDSDEDNIRRMKATGIKVEKDFAKLRVRALAANSDTIRGMATVAMVFDEMAFMMPGESNQSAMKVYTAAEPSLATFGPYAMIFCNSSPATKIGKFYEQVQLALRPPSHPEGWDATHFAIQAPSWAFFDYWWKDPQVRFSRALMVSPEWADKLEEDVESSVLNPMAKAMREKERLLEISNPDSYKVERRGQWNEVMDAYLNPDKVDQAFSGVLPNGSFCRRTSQGTYLYEYKGHCDPSSTTAGFGFAMAHVEEFEDPTGQFPGGMARHVVFDRVHRWNPKDFPGGTINYLKVQEDLGILLDYYRPTELTFDQYNSPGLIQGLREHVRTNSFSEVRKIGEVTATAGLNYQRWEAFKTALYLGLVHIPPDCFDPVTEFDHSEYASFELKFLREIATATTKRVDKQDDGPIKTKDIADCICEVTFKFLGSYLEGFLTKNLTAATAVTGAQGGYPIGGRHEGGPMAGVNDRKGQAADRFADFSSRRGSAGSTRSRGYGGITRGR